MNAPSEELLFVPLGGVGEIGMNFSMYGYGVPDSRRWIIVDVGIGFADASVPGVDLVLPDISFARSVRDSIEGIVVTHAHEDHYGGLGFLWDELGVPVHCTPFTSGLLSLKREVDNIPLRIFSPGDRFKLGHFDIQTIPVTHSIPEPVSLMLRTPLGNVFHSGDWKLDESGDASASAGPDSVNRFSELGDEGVLALICDSTNAPREGFSSGEDDVMSGLRDVMSSCRNRVFVTTFSSNVFRLVSIARVAESLGRRVMILGRSLLRVADVAEDLGYTKGISFVSEEEYWSVPRNELVVVCTGSQGEPNAILQKLARDGMDTAKVSAGDTIIFSSRMIPGNERDILDLQNRLAGRGAEIVVNSESSLVHVSGHPRRDELRLMYSWLRPEFGIPVHGEPLHLIAHERLMNESNITAVPRVRNGDIVRLAPGVAETVGEVTSGQTYLDGFLTGDFEFLGLKDRIKLSRSGHIVVFVVVDSVGDLAGDITLSCRGIPEEIDGELFSDLLYDSAIDGFESVRSNRRGSNDSIMNTVRRFVSRCCEDVWGKRPVVSVLVTRI